MKVQWQVRANTLHPGVDHRGASKGRLQDALDLNSPVDLRASEDAGFLFLPSFLDAPGSGISCFINLHVNRVNEIRALVNGSARLRHARPIFNLLKT